MRRPVGGWLGAIVSVLFLLSPPGQAAEPPPHSVPILLYHRLGPALTDDMTVTTPVVESQLKLIQERGYHVIPLKSLMASWATPRSRCRSAPWCWSPTMAIAPSIPTCSR